MSDRLTTHLERAKTFANSKEISIMGHWHEEGRENFGKRWSKVLSVIRILEGFGIYYVDPKPGNIMFAD